MDALSDMLQAVRLTGGIFLGARFTAPWSVVGQLGVDQCRPHLADPAQVIAYHYVVEGRMVVLVEGEAPVEVRAGQSVLLPRNDPHVLASDGGLPPVKAETLVQPPRQGGLARIVHGGGGALTQLACGFLGTNQYRNPLLETLPRVLTVDMAGAGSSDWIESSLRFALRGLHEGQVGTSTVMSRLSEVMFVEAVRTWATRLPVGQRGWMAGVRDPAVGRALALVHAQLDQHWTAQSLAREVALSRSAFCDRFTSLVGMPPIRYLTSWRLQVARDRLRDGRQSVAQIAYDVGYEAEVAFIRAFKRAFGLPPAAWRKQAQASEPHG